jgi:hypothetical protein
MFELPNLTDCTVFPLPESSTLEFKAGFQSSPQDKILATLCGFLNGGGGRLVIGVADDTCQILGIKTDKVMDKFLLQLDNIYHQHLLQKADKTPLPLGTVTSEVVQAAAGKKILIITAAAEPGEKYMMKDGTVWHRLAASNYKETALPTVYTEGELDAIVSQKLASQEDMLKKRFELERVQLVQKSQAEWDLLMKRFKGLQANYTDVVHAAKKGEDDLHLTKQRVMDKDFELFQAVQSAKNIEQDLCQATQTAKKVESELHMSRVLADFTEKRLLWATRDATQTQVDLHKAILDAELTQAMLYTTIQLQKAAAEQRLASAKANQSWFSYISCCFYAPQITV